MNFETGHINYKDSAMGKMEQTYKEQAENQLIELQKLRQDFDNYRAEYAAYKAAEEHRAKVAKRDGILQGIISTLIVTIIGGLVVSYWPSIISAVSCLFHR